MTLGHFALAASHPVVLLDGYPVGANGDRAFCADCHRELRAGHRATVLAYRHVDTNQWDVPHVYCEQCAPPSVPDPTPGTVEVLAAGHLVAGEPIGDRRGRLHLTGIDVLGYAGPDLDPDSGTDDPTA